MKRVLADPIALVGFQVPGPSAQCPSAAIVAPGSAASLGLLTGVPAGGWEIGADAPGGEPPRPLAAIGSDLRVASNTRTTTGSEPVSWKSAMLLPWAWPLVETGWTKPHSDPSPFSQAISQRSCQPFRRGPPEIQDRHRTSCPTDWRTTHEPVQPSRLAKSSCRVLSTENSVAPITPACPWAPGPSQGTPSIAAAVAHLHAIVRVGQLVRCDGVRPFSPPFGPLPSPRSGPLWPPIRPYAQRLEAERSGPLALKFLAHRAGVNDLLLLSRG